MNDFASINTGDDIFGAPAWQATAAAGSKLDQSICRIKKNKAVVVRFLTDPSAYDFDPDLCLFSNADGTWVKYREVTAFAKPEHLSNGNTLSHRYVPVADYKINGLGERTDRGVRDPLQTLVVPSDAEMQRDYPPMFAQAKDILLVNAVFEEGSFNNDSKYDPTPGSVIILALSPLQRKFLETEYKTALKYSPDFKFTAGAWSLLWHNETGKAADWKLDLKQDTGYVPMSSVPEPINGANIIRAVRRECEKEAFASVESMLADDAAEAAAVEIDIVESFERAIAESTPAVDAAVSDAPRRVSIAYMKGKLREAGVDFAVRSTNDEIEALFIQHEANLVTV